MLDLDRPFLDLSKDKRRGPRAPDAFFIAWAVPSVHQISVARNSVHERRIDGVGCETVAARCYGVLLRARVLDEHEWPSS